jgi:hypothetical protein
MRTRSGAVSAKGGLSGLMAAGALAAICAFSLPGAASAAGFFQNYQVNTDFDIYSIALYQGTSPTGVSGGLTNSFNVAAPGGLMTDPFLKLNEITATYFLGVSDLGVVTFENDSETLPQKHLILALNNTFALGAIGQDFSALFTAYTETSLIDALILIDTPNLPDGDPGLADQLADKDAAYSLLFGFSDLVVTQGGAFGSTDNFSMVSFSTGSAFGRPGSNSFVTEGPVPEPSTWALMILGFGSAGAMLRRRRQTLSVAGA